MSFELDAIRIEPLRAEHARGAFCCTNPVIQNYCRNNARRNNDAYMVRVFVACADKALDVIGYYYLCLTSYRVGALNETAAQKFSRVDAVPAVYLGMIGVHTDFQKRGIGKLLMRDAMLRTAEIARNAGTYALTLDALDDELVLYYKEQFGFETFKEAQGLEMFLPIKTILQAIG